MSITLKNKCESLCLSLEKNFFFIYFNINPHINSLLIEQDINISNFLADIKNAKSNKKDEHITSFFLNLYIRLIAFTRDIYYGLGQKTLSYSLIMHLDKFFPQYTFDIINSFLFIHSKKCSSNIDLPYGSWCDIKYFTTFLMKSNATNKRKNEILDHIINSTNSQILNDLNTIHTTPYHPFIGIHNISNASKWAPTEKSNKVLFNKFANHWHAYHDPYNPMKYSKKYRKLCSFINTFNYKTPYSPIIPISLNTKYQSNFVPLNPSYFATHIKKLILNYNDELFHFIENQWSSYLTKFQFQDLYCIPLLDFSPSNDTFLYNSIIISCFLSHYNSFGQKILVSSQTPFIIDLSNHNTLFSKVKYIFSFINKGISSISFNIDKAIDTIYNAFNITNPNASNINIVIFIDNNKHIIENNPFDKPIHIMYWNISQNYFHFNTLENISYEYKFINSISHFTYSFFNKNFTSSTCNHYFSFLFHKRYQFLSYFN